MMIVNGIRVVLIMNVLALMLMGKWIDVVAVGGAFLCTLVPIVLEKVGKVKLTSFMIYFLTAFVVMSQWMGTYLRAYDYISWWDLWLHGLSAVLVALGAFILLKWCDPEFLLLEHKKYGCIASFVFFVTSSSAVFWEIFEFGADTLVGTNAQLGSLTDTMTDMIICVVIAGGFSFFIYKSLKKEQNNFVIRQIKAFAALNALENQEKERPSLEMQEG